MYKSLTEFRRIHESYKCCNTILLRIADKFSRYKVSAGHDLFTSVGFGLPNELCARGSVENFTKKLRTLFRNENKLLSFSQFMNFFADQQSFEFLYF